MSRVSGAAILLLIPLAGCIGSGGAPLSATPSLAVGSDLFDEYAGGIDGVVLDDEAVGLPDVRIQVRELKLEVHSGPNGTFQFAKLAPGLLTLDASKLGFDTTSSILLVSAGDVTHPKLVLKPSAVLKEPRVAVLGPFNGYFQCHWGWFLVSGPCGDLPMAGSTPVSNLWTNDKKFFKFKLESEEWEQIHFEARWTPSSAATDPFMVLRFSYEGRPGGHWFADSGKAKGGAHFTYTKGALGPGGVIAGGLKTPNANLTLMAWLDPAFTDPTQGGAVPQIVLNQRFDIMVTVFYNTQKPQKYSAFSA